MGELYLFIFLLWLSFVILFTAAIIAIRKDLNDIKNIMTEDKVINVTIIKKNE